MNWSVINISNSLADLNIKWKSDLWSSIVNNSGWRSMRINTCYKIFIWKPLYLFWANFYKSKILVRQISTFIATATVLFFHTCDCQIKLAICQSIRSAYLIISAFQLSCSTIRSHLIWFFITWSMNWFIIWSTNWYLWWGMVIVKFACCSVLVIV